MEIDLLKIITVSDLVDEESEEDLGPDEFQDIDEDFEDLDETEVKR